MNKRLYPFSEDYFKEHLSSYDLVLKMEEGGQL